jgi:hypothetical protein
MKQNTRPKKNASFAATVAAVVLLASGQLFAQPRAQNPGGSVRPHGPTTPSTAPTASSPSAPAPLPGPAVPPTAAPSGIAAPAGPTPPNVAPGAGGTVQRRPLPPNPNLVPATVGSGVIIGASPTFSPERIAFGDVWDGQTSVRTLAITTTATGPMHFELPRGPFYVSEIRELGPPTVSPPSPSSKSSGAGAHMGTMIGLETKAKVTFPEGTGPWTYPVVAAGNLLHVRLTFRPHFDLLTNGAGPKTSTMKVSGPALIGSYTFSVPLSGMFDGKQLSPIVALPQGTDTAIAGQRGPLTVRLVALGDPLTGKLVVSTGPGLKVYSSGPITLGPGEAKDVQVQIESIAPVDKSEVGLGGSVAFAWSRKGESTVQTSTPLPFNVTFVPASFERELGPNKCNGVQYTWPDFGMSANGDAVFSMQFGPEAYESRFEVAFPEAKRTLMHTVAPSDLNNALRLNVEESGHSGALIRMTPSFVVTIWATVNPGAPETLERYRALFKSTALLRCW